MCHSQLGLQFEDTIHNLISQCRYKVLREKEIVNKYGSIVNGIDHLILTEHFVITIQDKWKISKPTLQYVNHFTKASKRISDIEKKNYLGIYLSKMPLTSYAIKAFEFDNTYSSNKFCSIHSEIVDDIEKELAIKLYELGIYFYEQDGSTIMLNY